MMNERELAEFKARLRDKYGKYNKMKAELKNIQAEQAVLKLTEQALKRRHTSLDQFMSELERKKGISGYRDAQRAIEQTSAATAEVDAAKGKTLEDISRIVER